MLRRNVFNLGLNVSENWLFLRRFLGNGPRVKNTTERRFVSYDVCGFDDQVFQLYFSVSKKYLSSSLELCGPGVDVTVWCVHV